MTWNRVSILLVAALAMFIIAAFVAAGTVTIGSLAALFWIAVGLACWVGSQLFGL